MELGRRFGVARIEGQCNTAETQPEIWQVANLLIIQHGARAVSEATRHAGRMLDRGDGAGWHLWAARIRLAVEALQAPRWGEPHSVQMASPTTPVQACILARYWTRGPPRSSK
jgi:hypothetical protein